jgi:hypothetical protein
MAENYINKIVSYGKSALIPKRVHQSYMYHSNRRDVVNGYKHVKLGINDTLVARLGTTITDKVDESGKID